MWLNGDNQQTQRLRLQSFLCNCRDNLWKKWLPYFACICETTFLASEMVFCCGWFLGWVESSANKNWQLDFFWSTRLSWCYGNLHHLKMWLRHIWKKIPAAWCGACTEHLQQETLCQNSYVPDPSLGEYSQGEEEAGCQAWPCFNSAPCETSIWVSASGIHFP